MKVVGPETFALLSRNGRLAISSPQIQKSVSVTRCDLAKSRKTKKVRPSHAMVPPPPLGE